MGRWVADPEHLNVEKCDGSTRMLFSWSKDGMPIFHPHLITGRLPTAGEMQEAEQAVLAAAVERGLTSRGFNRELRQQ